ncbi:Protein CBG27250 [Caenorhabditis briggsae]|uniref:Protein CBG27250 n=1 Tax=Caenorhabditis briggsae TaxID=6238 RepID=B6IFX2_CAEBR|nr:Protein CBG27250 [Caenorhabditis briggsae]CAR98788.1 Protein CBG27250 [Caenorhabditis briggsae]
MPVYQNVPIDETIPANARRRKEKLAMFVVIFLFFFCFSSLAWYFHEKPNSASSSKPLIGYYREWGDKRNNSTYHFEILAQLIHSRAVTDESGNVEEKFNVINNLLSS